MNPCSIAFWLACSAVGLIGPVAAQGLRTAPSLGASRPAAQPPAGPRAADYIVAVVNS